MEITELSNNAFIYDLAGVLNMLIKFSLHFLVVFIITRYLYYTKSRSKDYLFSFILISISIFFLIYLLGSLKIKIGFALGLFAIFGIIRYRTESIPIREMTYLFAITAISVINALSHNNNWVELIIANLIFVLIIWGLEKRRSNNHLLYKIIKYDNIKLITPDKRKELIKDIETRVGLKVEKIEIGNVDFIKDSVLIKIYYKGEKDEVNTINDHIRF